MKEILEQLEKIEKQNEEILLLLRKMECADQLNNAVENLRHINIMQPNLQPKMRIVKSW